MKIPVFRKYRIFFFIFLLFIVIICCKSTQTLIPTQKDVTVAQAHWQGITMDQLSQGYNIFMDKCTDCHGVKKPEKYSNDDWYKIMKTMGRKAKLDSTKYYLVLHYILAKRETTVGK